MRNIIELFDFLGVRHDFLDKPGVGSQLPGVKLLGTTDLDALESPHVAWPRAFFTDAVATYEDPLEMGKLVEGSGDRPFAAVRPQDAVGGIAGPARRLSPTGRSMPATHYHLTQNATAFDIDAPSPGLVVLSEAWVPGDTFVTVMMGSRRMFCA